MDRGPFEEGRGTILVVDDEPGILDAATKILERAGYAVATAACGADAIAAVSHGVPPDLVLTDLHLPDVNGIEILARVTARHPDVATIVMTGRATIGSAVEAMRRGAYDYLEKPFFETAVLLSSVERALGHARLRARNRYLEQRISLGERFEDLIGASPAMRTVASVVETVAPTEATVLVLGESGTGKELVVRAIHRTSRRAERPFLAINCGALAESILESELFGHAKGAFTGAIAARKGLFEEAHGGTVFLDEVGELPPSVQVRLLRVLQEREIKPVGANESRAVDVRVVAATNRDLAAEVAAGRFRHDLFYRLNVVAVEVPSLRARIDDVPLLAHHFVRKHAARHARDVRDIHADAIDVLCRHAWPGNVRELENAIERAVVLARGSAIALEDLPASIRGAARARSGAPHATEGPIEPLAKAKHVFERTYLEQLIARTEGNLTEAARLAGLDRSNLRRLLRRFDFDISGDAIRLGPSG